MLLSVPNKTTRLRHPDQLGALERYTNNITSGSTRSDLVNVRSLPAGDRNKIGASLSVLVELCVAHHSLHGQPENASRNWRPVHRDSSTLRFFPAFAEDAGWVAIRRRWPISVQPTAAVV